MPASTLATLIVVALLTGIPSYLAWFKPRLYAQLDRELHPLRLFRLPAEVVVWWARIIFTFVFFFALFAILFQLTAGQRHRDQRDSELIVRPRSMALHTADYVAAATPRVERITEG
jgi:hypothetical protein